MPNPLNLSDAPDMINTGIKKFFVKGRNKIPYKGAKLESPAKKPKWSGYPNVIISKLRDIKDIIPQEFLTKGERIKRLRKKYKVNLVKPSEVKKPSSQYTIEKGGDPVPYTYTPSVKGRRNPTESAKRKRPSYIELH